MMKLYSIYFIIDFRKVIFKKKKLRNWFDIIIIFNINNVNFNKLKNKFKNKRISIN